MAQEHYNDVTISLCGETLSHVNLTSDDGAAEIDTTAATEAEATAEDGISDLVVGIGAIGSVSAVDLGDNGALTIANAAGSLAACAVFGKTVSGGEDQAVETMLEVRPYPA